MLSKLNFRRRRGALKTYNVVSLDGATLTYHLEGRALAEELLRRALEVVCVAEEKEYFGLVTFENTYPKWLQLNKPLKKQLTGKSPYTVHFRVRIYPRDHHSLLNSNTRLKCSTDEATHRLVALAVQMEVGDFNHHLCGAGYLSDLQILQRVTSDMEQSISQLHRLNRGKSDAECEEEFLDLAQEEQNYGVAVFQVQDSARQTVVFGVSPAGVTINLGLQELHNFEWDAISRVACKGKHITLFVSKTHARPAYQLQYSCPSSSLAQSTAAWCAELLSFFGTPALEERPKSRLRRFFSSRRSLRRRDNVGGVVRSHTHSGQTSGLIQRRVMGMRRLSVGGGEELSQNSITNRVSVRSPPAAENKLIIYGASGIASAQPSTTTPLTITTATTTTTSSTTPTSTTPTAATQHQTTSSSSQVSLTTSTPRSVNRVHPVDSLADRKSVSSLPINAPLSVQWEGMNASPQHVHSHSDVATHHAHSHSSDAVSEGGHLRRGSVPVFTSSSHTASPPSHPHKKPPAFSPRNSYHYGSHRHSDYSPQGRSEYYNDRSLPHHGDHRHGNHVPTARQGDQQHVYDQSPHRHGNHIQTRNGERNYREGSPHVCRDHSLHHHGDKAYQSSPHICTHHCNGDHSPHRHSNHQLNGEHSYNRHSNYSSNHNSPSIQSEQLNQSPRRHGNHPSPKLYYNVRSEGTPANTSPPSHRHTPHTPPHNEWYNSSHHRPVAHSQSESLPSHPYPPSHPPPHQAHTPTHPPHQAHTPTHPPHTPTHPHGDNSPHGRGRDRNRPLRDRPSSATYKSRSLPIGANPNYRVNGEAAIEREAPREPLDPAHPARPRNRGPFRLSLQDSNYYHYDNGRLYSSARYPSKPRRSRTTTVGSTSSLSQPAELSWGMTSQLGSIASLEHQASLAELSQAESPSYMDAHTRSFVFEASQGCRDVTGTEL